jgi:hypothetical protein
MASAKKSPVSAIRNLATTKWLYRGMIVSLVSALIVSLYHLSVSVAAYEVAEGWLPPGLTSFIFAVAVESGVLFISSGISDRRRKKESATGLFWALGFFSLVNFYGNVSYTLSNIAKVDQLIWANVEAIDSLKILSAMLFSAVLPVMIITLSELRSQFHQKLKSEEYAQKLADDKERRKQEKKLLREQRKASRQSAPASLESVRNVKDLGHIEFADDLEEEDEVQEPVYTPPAPVVPPPAIKKNSARKAPERNSKPATGKDQATPRKDQVKKPATAFEAMAKGLEEGPPGTFSLPLR